MSDIYREVEEAVRRERLDRLWKRYGGRIIGAALLIAVGGGGAAFWQSWQENRRVEAGEQFDAALTKSGKDERHAALKALASHETGTYAALAQFHLAAELARNGKWKEAVKIYDRLTHDPTLPPILQDLAQIDAGFLLAGRIPFAELRQRLDAVAGKGRPFRFSAREVLAVAALEAGDPATARDYLTDLIAEPTAPASLLARARALIETAPDSPANQADAKK